MGRLHKARGHQNTHHSSYSIHRLSQSPVAGCLEPPRHQQHQHQLLRRILWQKHTYISAFQCGQQLFMQLRRLQECICPHNPSITISTPLLCPYSYRSTAPAHPSITSVLPSNRFSQEFRHPLSFLSSRLDYRRKNSLLRLTSLWLSPACQCPAGSHKNSHIHSHSCRSRAGAKGQAEKGRLDLYESPLSLESLSFSLLFRGLGHLLFSTDAYYLPFSPPHILQKHLSWSSLSFGALHCTR